MNAASRALAQTLYGSENAWEVFFTKQLFIVILLGVAVFVSGLAVVYSKDLNRRLYIATQNEQSHQVQLQTEYGQLLLEQSAWSTQARIEQIASNQLQLQAPDPRKVILVTT